MNDFVRNMHTSSGLLEDLEASAVSMEEATEQVLSYIKRFVPQEGKALLAGNSVGTDKMFLEANMPSVVEHLHYRLVDVSSIKELAKRWYRAAFTESPDKHGGHRALADILESIQELEYYRRVLFPAEPVTTERAREVAREVVALGIPAIGAEPRPDPFAKGGIPGGVAAFGVPSGGVAVHRGRSRRGLSTGQCSCPPLSTGVLLALEGRGSEGVSWVHPARAGHYRKGMQ